MNEDENTARKAWGALRRHRGAGQPIGSSWDELPEHRRDYLINWARYMREQGWLQRNSEAVSKERMMAVAKQAPLLDELVDAFLSPDTKDFSRIADLRVRLDAVDPNWRVNMKEQMLNRVRKWTSP
jgi:hypothetical protein